MSDSLHTVCRTGLSFGVAQETLILSTQLGSLSCSSGLSKGGSGHHERELVPAEKMERYAGGADDENLCVRFGYR